MAGSPGDDVRFASKRDAWLMVILWVTAVVLVGAGVCLLFVPGPVLPGILLAVLLLLAAVFVIWLPYTTAYTVTASMLEIRCGPFQSRVNLAGIEEITPSQSMLASPACSLDRLHVVCGGSGGARRDVLISPSDKAGFLAAVARRTPHLVVQGDRLVREEGAGA